MRATQLSIATTCGAKVHKHPVRRCGCWSRPPQHVRWFDVAVDHAAGVDMHQRRGHLPGENENFVRRERGATRCGVRKQLTAAHALECDMEQPRLRVVHVE
jgi:hypothetical protein|tara:strand:+ start:621 stop:923 length:303 start_codon:yes stop_codon:yes gene_type:complete